MNRKALAAGVLVSLVGVALLFLYMQRYELEASGGEKVPVLMVIADLGIGEPITEAALSVRDLPSRFVEDRHVRFEDRDRVLGIRAANGLRANQTLLWTDLATAIDGRRDLSGLLRPGMRAITITVERDDAIVGLLRPGDRVDLLFSAIRPNTEDLVTITLLQNLLVLAVGTDTGGEQPTGDRPRTTDISIATTLEQATLITHAMTEGRVQLTLRNPDDIEVVEGTPEYTNDDLIEPAKRDEAQMRRRPPRPTVMMIERVGN